MVSEDIISDCIVKTKKYGNAITVIPCAEAMMQTEDGVKSVGSYPRNRLKRTQTPHGFKLGDICQLHRDALEAGITNSVASCTLMIEMGKQVNFSAGSEKNIKLTTVDDIDIFKALLLAKRSDWLK
jgi:2-C-methyl-D-erythritol 4-phosphate cytidylyltransferase